MKRIPSLDGLRAISILLVVFGHLARRLHGPQLFWENYPLIGVRIFYVISGYLITHILIREQQRSGTIKLRDFYIRRAFRIFPAALVFLVIVIAFNWSGLHWYHIAAAFLYLVNFDFTRPWFLGHLWSLSVEEQFYFLWPGVLKRWYKHALFILVGVIIFTPCYELVLYSLKAAPQHFFTFPAVADTFTHSAYMVLPVLGCACLSYYLVEQPMLRLREKKAGKAALEISQPELQSSGHRRMSVYKVRTRMWCYLPAAP